MSLGIVREFYGINIQQSSPFGRYQGGKQSVQIIKTTLILCLLFAVGGAYATTGVALVHGTGQQTDAYNEYWGGTFVNSVRQGLDNPDNYVVINCDFNEYMWAWEASGCLATQLTTFIESRGITDLVVITHSNGGNVMRWILSNPTWDSRYPKIINTVRWVDALAPSSAGTPLADAAIAGTTFEESVAWLLGYANDAVRQQQTSWMAFYNANWLLGTAGRPALPRGFWTIVGTDVETAVWDPDSYCGGYAYNLGLEVTQAWLDSCSDGFINCTSQAAAGDVWFYDTSYTTGAEPLSHKQACSACFGIDVILRNDI